MKLYATVTSERASKGQGGNKSLVVNLKIDLKKRIEIGNLVMKYEDGQYTVYYYPINENCQGQEINSGRVMLYKNQNWCEICSNEPATYGKRCTMCHELGHMPNEELIPTTKSQKDKNGDLCNCGKNPGFHEKQNNCI